jgi:hypothetical protein
MPLSYESIPGGSDRPYIRLLHLRPCHDTKHDIETDLEVVALEKEPQYEALSYAWGDPKKTVAIKCGGATFKATKNLFSALKHLRYPERTRTLWVDAICINQDDGVEKSHQVRIMGSIYRSAERVLIWLGPAADGNGLAFKYIDRVFGQLRRCSPSVLHLYAEHYDNLAVDFNSICRRFAEEAAIVGQDSSDPRARLFEMTLDTEEEQDAFSALMRRPWWTRVWIIQELCLASHAMVICGNSSASWEAFTFGLAHCLDDEDSFVPLQKFATYHSLARTRLNLPNSSSRPDLLVLLSAFRWFRATDPRDKVYSLLGMAKESDILPDYKETVESCYKRIAHFIILHSETLDILDLVVPPSSFKRHDMPSWVPDWSYDETSIRNGFAGPALHDIGLALNNKGGQTNELNQPLSESQARFDKDDDNILVLKGTITDSVAALEDIIRMPSLVPPMALSDNGLGILSNGLYLVRVGCWGVVFLYRMGALVGLCQRLMEFAQRASPRPEQQSPNDGLNSLAHLLGALKGDLIIEEMDDDAKDAKTLLKFWDRIANARVYRIFRRLGFQRLFPFLYKYLLGILVCISLQSEDIDMEGSGFLSIGIDRRPALTQKGRLCFTRHTCRVGDHVALLRGGRHPYIVRPTVARWELVGPCYVSRAHMEEMRKAWLDGNAHEMAFE